VGDPVSPGSRWETILYLPTEPPLGVVKVPTHCLLQDIVTEGKRRLAQIDFAGSCAIMARRVEPRWVAGAPDMQIRRLQLAVTGRLQLDLACGLPASLVLNLRGRAITVVGGPQSPRVGVPGEFVSERELAVAPATEAAPPAGKEAVSGS